MKDKFTMQDHSTTGTPPKTIQIRKAFKYRLYPTKPQTQAMTYQLAEACRLYNAALQERRDAYRKCGVSLNYYDQSLQLKAIRSDGTLGLANFSCCQRILRRLDQTFAAFFRRVKAGQKAGYPRFKSARRFDSISFTYGDGTHLRDGKVYFQGIGWVKVKLHRPLEGTIKTVTLKREADGWHVVFSCDLGDLPFIFSEKPPVGIDLGLKAFLVTSDNQSVEPPQYYRKTQAKLRKAQRHLARCKRGSNRRKKAVQRIARLHLHVANQRRDFHHKIALSLVKEHGVIVHEALNIQGIARTRLAKSTHDVGWGQFLNILAYKAEGAGVQVLAVPAYNTTQVCSACGCLPDIPKTLKDRVHSCPHCGYTADRDLNAALNVLQRGINWLGSSRQTLTQRDTAYVV